MQARSCANRSKPKSEGTKVMKLNRVVSKSHVQSLLFAGIIGALATGCTTYQQQNKVILCWQQGNLTNAVAEATKMANANADNKDTVIWRLEQGAVLRANGQYEDSNKAFDQAQEKIDQYAREAKVKLGHEAGALMSNQANLPYEGRAYDGIMLNTYRALNFLALGEIDKARPELIRAYQRQQDAVEDNKKRIEAAQAQATNTTATATTTNVGAADTTAPAPSDSLAGSMFRKKSKKTAAAANASTTTNTTVATSNQSSAAVDKAQKDPKFQAQMQGAYTNLDNLKPYANYVNPFTVYLDGLYFMANAADASDLERAHKSLERVSAFASDNDYVKQDLATVNNLINGKPLTPTTYIIFETGCAPVRDQIRIDIPIIVTRVSYVGAAFPTLKPQGNYVPSLIVTANNTTTATTGTSSTANSTITTTNSTTPAASSTTETTSSTTATTSSTTSTANSTTATTSLVASMDSVIGLDFKNELPIIVAKTIAATVTKAVAAYAVNQAASQQSDIAGLFAQIGTAVYQAAVNIADERTWTTLPKEFQVCRIPTPPDRKIDLATSNGLQKTSVTIGDGTINIIYVKSINPVTPLLVTQAKLK
jgi:uncharacterized protein